MNILKEVLRHEVFPSLGCTEPIAIAYAASVAGREVLDGIEQIEIVVDPGVYKNGFAVTVPNTDGEKGNLIAGVLGALIKRPELKMEVLESVTPELISQARELISRKKASIRFDISKTALYIDVIVKTARDTAQAVIEGAHTNLVLLKKNDQVVFSKEEDENNPDSKAYRSVIREMTISELVDAARALDEEDSRYIRQGIDMNLEIAAAGQQLRKVGYYLADLKNKSLQSDDIVISSKILTASAVDARMGGLSYPVMSSGGSGNQGIVAILVPFQVGKLSGIKEPIIIQSIALSHLMNSYVKCFTGELSPICGCSIAAGVGAAVAIVFQRNGKDMQKIALAVNNLTGDLGGMFCDGAKGSCAFKVATSTDSVIRSAFLAMNNYGICQTEGFAGRTPEETIRNLGKISKQGMAKVDETLLEIMIDKSSFPHGK